MRKTIYILFAILGMSLFAGCDDDKKDNNTPLAKQLVGEWRLTSWTSEAPQAFDAYIAFDGGSFTIYQKVESVRYQKYTGNYLLQDDVLSGNYSDNTPWGSSYTVTADEANNTITLTSTIDTGDVSVYTRASIPESVKNDAIDMQGVRAGFLPAALSPGCNISKAFGKCRRLFFHTYTKLTHSKLSNRKKKLPRPTPQAPGRPESPQCSRRITRELFFSETDFTHIRKNGYLYTNF